MQRWDVVMRRLLDPSRAAAPPSIMPMHGGDQPMTPKFATLDGNEPVARAVYKTNEVIAVSLPARRRSCSSIALRGLDSDPSPGSEGGG